MRKLYLVVGLVGLYCFNILAGLGGGLVSGTISANSGSGVGNANNTNQIQNLYNDTNALWYANTVGMSDQTARNNLSMGVQDLKQMGTFTNVVAALMLDPLENPNMHIDLLGNPFTFQNEQYTANVGFGAAGAYMQGTNIVTINLPRTITNYTLVIWYWQNPSNCDNLIGGNSGLGYAMGELYNPTYDSGFIPDAFNTSKALRVWSSPGGANYNTGASLSGVNTNAAQVMMNGQYDTRLPIGILHIVAYTGGTNGLVSCFMDGKPCYFKNSGMHTYTCQLSTNAPYTTLTIGGAATTSWGNAAPGLCTNAIGGVVFGGAILFDARSDGDWRYQAAGFKFATDISRYGNSVVKFDGSSIINLANFGGNVFGGGTQPETNCMPVIFQQQNPTVLTMCDAAPGSSMANYATMNADGTNYFYPYGFFYLNTNRFPYRTVETDGPRNDAFSGKTLPVIFVFLTNWTYYVNNGVQFVLIDDHMDYSVSIANNLNWRSTILMIESNYPVSFVVNESGLVSSNFLAKASLDNPPIHADAYSYQAVQLQTAFACLCAGKPNPYPWLEATYNSIGAGNPLMDAMETNMTQWSFRITDNNGASRVTQDSSGLTNGFQNTTTYTNFLIGSSFTNTTTRSELVFVNARCNPTTVVSALFGLVTSPTGAIYTTNGPAGLEADTIFTTVPHGWYQLTATIPSGGIWKVVDISGGGAVTITNSYYQTLQ